MKKVWLILCLLLSLCLLCACNEGDHVHEWGEWQTETAATCTTKGVEKRTCECGESETQYVDAFGHSSDNEWRRNENNHWQFCIQAGCRVRLNEGAHTYDAADTCVCQHYNGALTFTLKSGTYSVTDCDTSAISVVIPSQYKGVAVTSIGDEAFHSCTDLTSVTISDNVTTIGEKAFYGCTGLTSVTIGKGVASIGNASFSGCTGLTGVYITDLASWLQISFGYSYANPLGYAGNLYLNGTLVTDLVIPTGVTSIGMYAFYGCTCLTSVTIPDSVTSIDNDAFFRCTGLTGVYVTDLAAWCRISFGSWGANPLCQAEKLYLNGTSITELVIPTGVTGIGNYAFSGCTSLKSVMISDNVTKIGDYAFEDCVGLKSVTIGNSVTSIGDYAFFWCKGMTSVTIPNSVTSIGKGAFSACDSLKSVTIPDSVTSIGSYAFSSCTGIIQEEGGVFYVDKWVVGCDTAVTSVTLRQNTVGIEGSAFYDCTSLTSITIPDGVTSIGDSAFYDCTSLVTVAFGTNSQLTSIGSKAFEGCTSLKSIAIPDSVTSIGKYAFRSCSNLTTVTCNTTGWWVATDANAASGTAKALTAYNLRSTYRDYYWKRG